MQIRGRELTVPHLVLAVLILTTVGVSAIAVGTSSAAFGAYNPGWDGATDLRSLAGDADAEVQIVRSDAGYHEADAERATAFVLSPTESSTEAEAQAISGFLARGGTVVVANERGSQANQLLADLNADSRFDGRQLRDEQQYYGGPGLPVATPVRDSPVTRNVSQITLNYGTTVTPSENGTVLVNSSSFSYLDTNANGDLDGSEPIRQYPVVVREEVANGSVILVSDASVFINEMLERPGNQQFAGNLMAPSETVLFDYRLSEGVPTAVALLHTAAETPLLQWIIVAVLTVGAGVAWTRAPGSSNRSPSDPAADGTHGDPGRNGLAERIADRHPEWSAERVERVAKSITRNGQK